MKPGLRVHVLVMGLLEVLNPTSYTQAQTPDYAIVGIRAGVVDVRFRTSSRYHRSLIILIRQSIS